MNQSPHLVFYDDACPMCSKEIDHYRKLETCHPIQWVPIHLDEEMLNKFGFEKQELLKVFHVVKEDGTVLTGAAAFATLWHSTKRYRFAGTLAYRLHLIPIMDIFYYRFAKWRYKRQVCES